MARFPARSETHISTSTQDTPSPHLSIVIPAYNEAQRLPPTLRSLHHYLQQQSYPWEILVVSNGSTDATAAVVEAAAEAIPGLDVVSIEERGKGIATKTGVLRSRGEIVFLCDADLSMPAECIADFLRELEIHDVVAGSREAPGAHRYGEPWHRHLMGRVFNHVVQILTVHGIEDTQCGFKAFRRGPARILFESQSVKGFGFDVEILYLAQKFGYTIKELGIPWYFDLDTRVRPGIDSLSMVGEVLMVRLRDALGRYQPPVTSQAAGGDVAR